jgi:PAS domain S-box-containing protein
MGALCTRRGVLELHSRFVSPCKVGIHVGVGDVTGRQILVVEDEAIVAKNLENGLRRLGYTVTALVDSGPEAIGLAGEARPHLVLMDIRLKGEMDGVTAAGEIRTRFGIPVIYLTAHVDDATLQRAKATEPLGYIVKPFRMEDLQSSIEMALYKHEMEQRLRASEERYRMLFDHAYDAVILEDANREILDANRAACELFGYARDELIGRQAGDPESAMAQARSPLLLITNPASVVDMPYETVAQHRTGRQVPVELTTAPLRAGGQPLHLTIARDISRRKQAEEERERLILQLQEALARVKTLSGLLPICAACKRIRDDQGYWTQVEVYVRDRSEAEFTHGICPDCIKELYPDYQGEVEGP